jgi:hypothetical protein
MQMDFLNSLVSMDDKFMITFVDHLPTYKQEYYFNVEKNILAVALVFTDVMSYPL